MQKIKPGRYTKRLINVEAVRITRSNADVVAAWCRGSVSDHNLFGVPRSMVVEIPNGQSTEGVVGDWVVHYADEDIFMRAADEEFRAAFRRAPEPGTTDDKLRRKAAREFSIATERMEEAQMRYAHGRHMQEGSPSPSDVDRAAGSDA